MIDENSPRAHLQRDSNSIWSYSRLDKIRAGPFSFPQDRDRFPSNTGRSPGNSGSASGGAAQSPRTQLLQQQQQPENNDPTAQAANDAAPNDSGSSSGRQLQHGDRLGTSAPQNGLRAMLPLGPIIAILLCLVLIFSLLLYCYRHFLSDPYRHMPAPTTDTDANTFNARLLAYYRFLINRFGGPHSSTRDHNKNGESGDGGRDSDAAEALALNTLSAPDTWDNPHAACGVGSKPPNGGTNPSEPDLRPASIDAHAPLILPVAPAAGFIPLMVPAQLNPQTQAGAVGINPQAALPTNYVLLASPQQLTAPIPPVVGTAAAVQQPVPHPPLIGKSINRAIALLVHNTVQFLAIAFVCVY